MMKSTLRRFLIFPLLIIFTVAGTLPFDGTLAFRDQRTRMSRSQHRSRAWWRRRRAVLRRRRLLAQRRRLLAKLREQHATKFYRAAAPRSHQVVTGMYPAANTVAHWSMRHNVNVTLPAMWTTAGVATDIKFFVRGANGQAIGTAVLAPVAFPRTASTVETAPRQMRRMVGGIPLVGLRRMVIDRMVAEGGWVINDVVREINGQTVFVVFAQTDGTGNFSSNPRGISPAHAQQQSWTFYFMAVNNQAYSLVTSGPTEFASALAADSEQVVASLRKLQKQELATSSSPHPIPAPTSTNYKVKTLPSAATVGNYSRSNSSIGPEPE